MSRRPRWSRLGPNHRHLVHAAARVGFAAVATGGDGGGDTVLEGQVHDGEVFEAAFGVGAQPVLPELRIDRPNRRAGQVLHLPYGVEADFVQFALGPDVVPGSGTDRRLPWAR